MTKQQFSQEFKTLYLFFLFISQYSSVYTKWSKGWSVKINKNRRFTLRAFVRRCGCTPSIFNL